MRPTHLLLLATLIPTTPTAAAPPQGQITGIGGIFIKSPNPKALAAWYKDVLGLPIQPWGGAILSTTAPAHPPVVTWTAFPQTTHYFAPSTRDVMIDFAVDNLDAVITRLKQHNVPILKRDDTDPNGKFAWLTDPDGTKIELWQPNK
jgi:catechol 2,3-dioxygenase-like lactoylglutathione lyase family enzyme